MGISEDGCPGLDTTMAFGLRSERSRFGQCETSEIEQTRYGYRANLAQKRISKYILLNFTIYQVLPQVVMLLKKVNIL